MSIDYDQLKALVKEAMFTGGGINEPSAPEGIPHRMPAAEPSDKEQDQGNEKANELYAKALTAREATELLVEALDEPIYDDAYEHAFKASACLRRALNSLEGSGAHPMPQQRVVAPPKWQQKYGAGSNAGDYAGGGMLGTGMGSTLGSGIGMQEQEDVKLGAKTLSKAAQAQGEKERGAAIGKGDVLQGVDNRERAILTDVEKVLTQVADVDDLIKYRPMLQAFLKKVMKLAKSGADETEDTLAAEL
tara:strand:+ start:1704 stop:2444 length:741 start_codon:yes stop_codon:yes gene_type:complete